MHEHDPINPEQFTQWDYDEWESGEPYEWSGAARGGKWDSIDFHVDLGCGRLKKGRIGIDRYAAPGVNIVADLDGLSVNWMAKNPNDDVPAGITWNRTPPVHIRSLPFPTSSIESIISYHALEHIGAGFIPLIDEVYRVLKPDGIFRAITPLFPSRTAVEDPDHKRYFMTGTWASFCGTPGEDDDPQSCWLSSFSVPYTSARFHMEDHDYTPPLPLDKQWEEHDARELRVALRAMKETK